MQINWNEFFAYNFWFKVDRISFHTTDKAVLVGALLMLVVSIVFAIYRAKQKNPHINKTLTSFIHILVTVGVLEVLWFGFRYQLADVLGTRIVPAIILLFGIIWAIWPVKYLLFSFKKDNEQYQKQVQKEKYLK